MFERGDKLNKENKALFLDIAKCIGIYIEKLLYYRKKVASFCFLILALSSDRMANVLFIPGKHVQSRTKISFGLNIDVPKIRAIFWL